MPEWEALVTITFLSIVILITIVGNILVIISVLTYAPLKITPNYFIVSLAVADLMVSSCVLPFNIVSTVLGRWVSKFFWCACMFRSFFLWQNCQSWQKRKVVVVVSAWKLKQVISSKKINEIVASNYWQKRLRVVTYVTYDTTEIYGSCSCWNVKSSSRHYNHFSWWCLKFDYQFCSIWLFCY